MDTQGPGAVDPADQWVLDPATGEYRLRTDQPPVAANETYAPAYPNGGTDAGAGAVRNAGQGMGAGPGMGAGLSTGAGAFTVPDPSPATRPRPAGSSRAAGGRRSAASAGGRRAAASGGRRRAAGRSSRRKPRGHGASGRPVAVWAAGGLGLVLVLGGVGVAVAQRHSGAPTVHAVDVGDAAAPTLSTSGPLNVLLINAAGGQGSSDGGGQAQGTAAAGADSAVLLHLSADRRDATAVTIPGDLVTAIPDCPVRQRNGTTSVVRGTPVNGTSPKFRQSLGVQGRDPGCTMRTVDRLTGVKVDHFVLADARAIQELTTAAGGVPVCLKDPLSDPAVHLDLAAGQHRLTAAQAPGFLTTRNAPPGHEVVDRARLQQAYFGALLRQWKSGGAPVGKDLADASARTLTVDPALARAGALDTLAGEIGKVDLTHVTFAALPTAKATGIAVTLDTAAAAQLFSLVTRDVPLSARPPEPDPKLIGPKATPHDTRVTVLNGTHDFGASQDVLNWLQNDKGVNRSANGGDAPATLAATRLDYAPNQADQARSLAAMMGLPASALHEGAKDVPPLTYMTLTLGKDYTAPGTPIALPLTPPEGLETSTADSTACVG